MAAGINRDGMSITLGVTLRASLRLPSGIHCTLGMPCCQPLLSTHPELITTERQGYVEYRVKNQYLARDGSGRTVQAFSGWSFVDALIPVVLAIACKFVCF